MDMINIIMASYNGERYIREQIDSIICNTYTDWKLWIFDDGSTDSTIEILEEYEKRLPNKIIVRKNKKNLGVTKNFLHGVRAVSDSKENKNYYMFCDQDDVWMNKKIEKTLKAMKQLERKYGDCPLSVFTDATVVDEKLKVLKTSFFKTSELNPYQTSLNSLLMENKLIGCTLMFNSKVKEKLTVIPDEVRYHDWWIALITASFGHISYLNEATLLYRQHGNNVVGNKDYLSYIKKSILSLDKQGEAIIKTIAQGKAFYTIYKSTLALEQKNMIYQFSKLAQYKKIKKLNIILKYKFLKTGLIRNIGLLLIV